VHALARLLQFAVKGIAPGCYVHPGWCRVVRYIARGAGRQPAQLARSSACRCAGQGFESVCRFLHHARARVGRNVVMGRREVDTLRSAKPP
jgi:hypothetical protein